MRQPLFRAAGVAMARASASGPGDPGSLPWPEGSADVAPLRGFIKKAWAVDGLADAVELASPSLAMAVAAILDGDAPSPDKTTRAAMALARYVVRMRGRATPFGLFAGAAPARVGGSADGTWLPGHQPTARADGQWLAALVAGLEAYSPLRQRLRVRANDLIAVRGDRLVVAWLPHASPAARKARVEVSLRRTPRSRPRSTR